MSDLDELVPHFRKARDRWSAATTLGAHYEALTVAFSNNKFGLIDATKSFVECVCITILGEYGKPMPNAQPTPTQLLVSALEVLGLQNARGSSQLGKILSAYNKLCDALAAIRNENGPVAHGQDGFLDCLSDNSVRTFLLVGDTLLAVLLAALDGKEPDLQFTRELYDRFEHLHDRIDKSVSVEVSVDEQDDLQTVLLKFTTVGLPDGIELRIEPSRLLYNLDRTAYIEVLKSCSAEAAPAVVGVAEEATRPAVEPEPIVPAVSGEIVVPVEAVISVGEAVTVSGEVLKKYEGSLQPFREQLDHYLRALGVPDAAMNVADGIMVDQLLNAAEGSMGLDWQTRETLQAKMKVDIRRVLTEYGVESELATKSAEHLVTWLKKQVPVMVSNEIEVRTADDHSESERTP